jgi:hypothetical protein
MPDKLIKSLIDIDRSARERLDALKSEKANLDQFFKAERNRMLTALQDEIKGQIQVAQSEMKQNIVLKKAELESEYRSVLMQIEELYRLKKQTWIDEIYRQCTKTL